MATPRHDDHIFIHRPEESPAFYQRRGAWGVANGVGAGLLIAVVAGALGWSLGFQHEVWALMEALGW